MLVELGRPFGRGGHAAELHRRVTRVKGVPSALSVSPVTVGLDLHVLRDLDAVLRHGPLAFEVGQALARFAKGADSKVSLRMARAAAALAASCSCEEKRSSVMSSSRPITRQALGQ